MDKQGYIYILTNSRHSVLYIGVTSDLKKRIWEHKQKFVKGFTQRYNVEIQVYYESLETIEQAIIREKQLKGGSRKSKLILINSFNSEWHDLYFEL